MAENRSASPIFDDVALEYARHFSNLQLARKSFEEQRDRVMEQLKQSLVRRVAAAPLGLQETTREEDLGGWGYSMYVEGNMFAARCEKQQKSELFGDAIWVGFGSDESLGAPEPSMAFRGQLYFRMGRSSYVQLEQTFARLAAELKAKTLHAGRWARLVVEPVPIDRFGMDEFERSIDELFEAFGTADAALAEGYRRVWSLTGGR